MVVLGLCGSKRFSVLYIHHSNMEHPISTGMILLISTGLEFEFILCIKIYMQLQYDH
jgi:hypothetical protein